MKKEPIQIHNRSHPRLRLNTICPYFTMFPLAFPFQTLQRARKTDLVYDPFCGRGTTNFAARLLGLNSYGVDSNPIAQAVAQSKLLYVSEKEIDARCRAVLAEMPDTDLPQGEYWELAYHPETLAEVCKLRKYFMTKTLLDDIDISLRAIILGILHGPKMKTQASYLSNQMPRTFATKPNYSVQYWIKNGLIADKVDLASLVKRKAAYVFNEELPRKVGGQIILGDSRSIADSFDQDIGWVITSPPYFGMSTYEQDQWLRNWFLGGSDQVNYSSASQLKHGSETTFINDLAKVWSNTALKCKPNAKMVIRFGALPSLSVKTPREIIKESLVIADCGWELKALRSAGKPFPAKRQANQFKGQTGTYVEEIDVYATLTI
ncbi:DNA methyltransferase [Pedobacter sp. MR2016-24]|uniref:DNA methyltransferase n=1 Tax=Pedobacter sp. MR2016-24 TaxID=2994466 RepID=UPI0022459BAE|nr:DNA methyltransferase [Pedobacter sp. MR2016-24]